MNQLQAMIHHSLHPSPYTQFPRFLWAPLELQLTRPGGKGYAYLALPGSMYLTFNLPPDHDERVVGQWGKFMITRPETDVEREEREEAEAEEAFMERESNRYTQWYY